MKRLKLSLALVLGLGTTGAPTSVLAQAPTSSSSDSLVITGAELHVGNGKVIANATIVVTDGRIKQVGGPELAATAPAKHRRVDAKGKLVTPGFIAPDARLGLVEIGMEHSTVDRIREDDQMIRAGFDPSLAINASSSLIQIQAIEGVTSAAVAPSGGLLSGQVTWIDLVHGDHAGIVSGAKIAVDGQLGQSYAGSRAASIQLLRRTLEDASWLRKNQKSHDKGQSRELVAHPDDLRALDDVLDGKAPLTLHVHRASDILAALELKKKYKLDMVLLGCAEGWRVAQAIAESKTPVIVMPTENLPKSFDSLGARMDNAALLHAAGVEVSLGELGEAHNARNIKQEAGVAVANGLDHEVAIRAVTLNIARAYNMDKDYGSVEVGKVANLVIWDHDPFELDSFPEQVIIRGETIPMVSRQSLLRDRYMKRHGLAK
jgi:imidazolonepropionase-like amidohydrolase